MSWIKSYLGFNGSRSRRIWQVILLSVVLGGGLGFAVNHLGGGSTVGSVVGAWIAVTVLVLLQRRRHR